MLRRAIVLALLLTLLGSGLQAHADEDLGMTMRIVTTSLRSAASYARTGNLALAQIELNGARRAWGGSLGRFAEQPAPYPASAFRHLLSTGKERLAQANDALGASDGPLAASEILALRQSLRGLRHEAGLYELSDCVFDLAAPMEQLRAAALRFGEHKAAAEEVNSAGGSLREHLQRCNNVASPDIASEAEFRRLIDGAMASAGEIGGAAMAGDAGLVHRYQIELQSFVNLLDFQFS